MFLKTDVASNNVLGSTQPLSTSFKTGNNSESIKFTVGKFMASGERPEASNRPAPVGRLNLDAIERLQMSYNSAYRQNASILIPVDTSST